MSGGMTNDRESARLSNLLDDLGSKTPWRLSAAAVMSRR
jgi:hypothetical protein